MSYSSVAEIADHFKVTPRGVGYWFRTGEIPFVIRKGLNNKPTRYALIDDVKSFLVKTKRTRSYDPQGWEVVDEGKSK